MKYLTDYEFEDSQEIQKWLFNKGYQLTVYQCYRLWVSYSEEVHNREWVGFMHKVEHYEQVVEKYIIPRIAVLGEEAVYNVFARRGMLLSEAECKEISAKHLERNRYKGWRDMDNAKEEETFTDKAYNKYVKPIAVELGYITE